MSNEVLNDSLPTIAFPYVGRIIGMSWTPVGSGSGVEQVFSNDDYDRMEYSLNLENWISSERDALWEFYQDRKGGYDSFLFMDQSHYQVTSENIGTADGTTKIYQLTENGLDRKNIISGSVSGTLDGSPISEPGDFTTALIDDGQITFATTPASGDIVMTYQYYRRMRFAKKLEYNQTTKVSINIPDVLIREVVVP